MPPINLLIKPASARCNMRCDYCFYTAIAEHRDCYDYGMMSLDTLDTVVRKTLETAEGHCTFAFQGGEPTLAGVDFFRRLTQMVKQYNSKRLSVRYAMQTNGRLIDDEWAAFLSEQKFLTGLSIDGDKESHDAYRHDDVGEGTHTAVLRAATLLRKHKAEFNALTVVTAQTARHISRIYGFFKRNGFLYQQYIPCIEPDGLQRSSFSLTPVLYARFLKDLFDLWYHDIERGSFIYIRYYENLVNIIAGYPPEHCGMLGRCVHQTVIEADGSVFPCDFYATDPYKIGNIITDSFEGMETRRMRFIEGSLTSHEKCLSCEWKNICKGGCRRDRDQNGNIGLNRFCEAYKDFFAYATPRLRTIARRVR